MNINAWIAAEGMTGADFARLIEVSRQTAHRYLSGERLPEPAMMLRIWDVTDGLVRPDDWYLAWEARGRAA